MWGTGADSGDTDTETDKAEADFGAGGAIDGGGRCYILNWSGHDVAEPVEVADGS